MVEVEDGEDDEVVVVELLAEVDIEVDAEEEVMVESVVAVGEADDAEVVLTVVELTGVVDAVLEMLEFLDDATVVVEMVELLDNASVVVEVVELPIGVAVDRVELLYVAEELVAVELFKNEAVEEAVVLDVVDELVILSLLNCAKRAAKACGATYS